MYYGQRSVAFNLYVLNKTRMNFKKMSIVMFIFIVVSMRE